MRVRQPARAGFTLVEVVVALAISGLVLLAARQMLEALAAHSARVTALAHAADRDANGERLLRAVVGDLEVGTADTRQFEGREREARFTSWCDTPADSRERCRVTLAVDSADGMPALRLSLAGEDAPWSRSIIVRRGGASGALRYLGDAGQGGTWFRVWGRGITAPLAIAVILGRAADIRAPATDSAGVAPAPRGADTLIVRIGERG